MEPILYPIKHNFLISTPQLFLLKMPFVVVLQQFHVCMVALSLQVSANYLSHHYPGYSCCFETQCWSLIRTEAQTLSETQTADATQSWQLTRADVSGQHVWLWTQRVPVIADWCTESGDSVGPRLPEPFIRQHLAVSLWMVLACNGDAISCDQPQPLSPW